MGKGIIENTKRRGNRGENEVNGIDRGLGRKEIVLFWNRSASEKWGKN